ncbi:hypothetical protein FH972_021817 [Carpinus fangiana]|uniref:Uncharacterized protein n=1 Tax=Carpinus fangiana TaxID=176857 RepID=A0A5N6KQY9_9ROSI|nr:hypothetical protein FH972_021817 [Carpinus fangiana]
MSPQAEGRQSPDPETQDPKQGTAQQANPNDQGAGPDSHAQANSDTKAKLSSNPVGPLDKAAEEKTSK